MTTLYIDYMNESYVKCKGWYPITVSLEKNKILYMAQILKLGNTYSLVICSAWQFEMKSLILEC